MPIFEAHGTQCTKVRFFKYLCCIDRWPFEGFHSQFLINSNVHNLVQSHFYIFFILTDGHPSSVMYPPSSAALSAAAVQQLLRITPEILSLNAQQLQRQQQQSQEQSQQQPVELPPVPASGEGKPANPLNRCRCQMCIDPNRAGRVRFSLYFIECQKNKT